MQSENEVVYLYLDDIIPNRFQPRELFDERALKELAVSIKEHGVIQPIIVRKNGEKYEIIAGERRYKASALAGLTKIPAIVRNLDDKESSKVALLENLQRKNLNPIEEAKTYQKILELDQMTQEELAKTMGKSQSAVANKLRLLSLSEPVQNALLNAKISERHARTLLSVEDKEEQEKLLKEVIQNRITVRELERLIKQKNNLEEEIEQEEPKQIERPPEREMEFKEPEFNSQPNNYSPPLPDTMIDFEDVTKELQNNNNNNNSKPNLEQPMPQPVASNNGDNMNNNNERMEENFQPKFINYGEIDPDLPDEDEEDDEEDGRQFQFTSTPQPSFPEPNNNVAQNRPSSNNEQNMNESMLNFSSQSNNHSSLDNLLNLNESSNNGEDVRARRSAEENEPTYDDYDDDEDIDEDSAYATQPVNFTRTPKKGKRKKVRDRNEYEKGLSVSATFDESLFKTPTIEDFEKKNQVSGPKSLKSSSYKNALKQEIDDAEDDEDEEYFEPVKEEKVATIDLQQSISAIRDTLKTLEQQDVDIDTEEMDFEHIYQIVIKIKKNSIKK